MKQLTIDFDLYVKDLQDQAYKSYSQGAEYVIRAIKAGEPYPEDVQKALDDLDNEKEGKFYPDDGQKASEDLDAEDVPAES